IVRALERFGLGITELSGDDLAHSNLASFDEIVVGPNAYLVRDDVRQNASRLLEYVEHGGTLIVQYQGYGYQAGGFAPFPFAYAQPHDRVTFPDAPVTILEPEHPLLRLPNEISEVDFEGWVHDVVQLMSERWFDDGSMLAHEGEPARELFLIVEGEVEVVKEAKSDRPLWVASSGEAVGELGVLAEVPRTASLRARGHVKTLTM